MLAEEQTAGRGRRGRSWSAPPGSSILMSVLLFPPPALAETAWLTALGAVAVAEVVAGSIGIEPTIKWPNDVRIDGRKVAGVLVERSHGPGPAVVGIGLNVNSRLDDLPEELRATATSLQIVSGRPTDRSELARRLIQTLDAFYLLGRRQGPESLNAPWRDRSEHLGREVRVSTPHHCLIGRLEDLHVVEGITLRHTPGSSDGQRIQIALRDVLSLVPSDHHEGTRFPIETGPGD